MTKQQKTKTELEALILERARLTMTLERVSVFGAGTQWQATFAAKSHLMLRYVPQFEGIVAEMRAIYDLKRIA